jgi:sulfotransferase
MDNGIHFISGLPRSGSTLLAAILKQNTNFHAGMTSPVGSLVAAMLRQMSQDNEAAVFIDDEKREAILRSCFSAFYQQHRAKLVFDTNRMWCAKLPLLTNLYPRAKVIACVRQLPWIIDSIERIIRTNKFEPSKIFGFEVGGTVYTRFEALGTSHGMVGFPFQALKEAFFGEEADRLMLLTYESLTTNPKRSIREVYDFIGEEPFEHDFENIEFNADEFDARLGTPGLHAVGRKVKASKRQTVLPPDLYRRMENDSFWLDDKVNIRGVKIV